MLFFPGAWGGEPILAGMLATVCASVDLQAADRKDSDRVVDSRPEARHVSADSAQTNWTSFRGPGANGHAASANPPLEWSVPEEKNILWKTPVPRRGMSSPIVWANQLFLTGADPSTRELYCYDTDTGKLLWTHGVDGVPGSPFSGVLPDVMDETGFAAPTPTTDGRHVAAVFGTGELVCVNMKGERVWVRHLGVPKNHYGHASSLIHHRNLLIVQYDQNENSRLLAFDLASGDPAWQVPRGAISWASPILIDNRGRTEVIVTNSKGVDSYDPATGERLWHVECLAGEVAASAAYANGTLFVASDGATASAIRVGDRGPDPAILWQWDEALPDAPSLLADERHLIVPTGFGVVSCLDGKTGKLLWEHEFDEGSCSSPVLVGDRVYLIERTGTTQVFRMDDQFELLGASKLGEDVYATPAFVGDNMYIRGVTHLFCIGKRE